MGFIPLIRTILQISAVLARLWSKKVGTYRGLSEVAGQSADRCSVGWMEFVLIGLHSPALGHDNCTSARTRLVPSTKVWLRNVQSSCYYRNWHGHLGW